MNILIRHAVLPDVEELTRLEHCVKTENVWQMSQSISDGSVQTVFMETHLPREMRLTYPRTPDTLERRWKDYVAILVACVEKAPVGYATLAGHVVPDLLWIYDLVVDEIWRRKGVATALFHAIRDWSLPRGYARVMLEMTSKNYPAICFARSHKFEFTGYNDNYFINNDIALFFSRFLK
jgi:GNAT superfamily N-acetyltransferase